MNEVINGNGCGFYRKQIPQHVTTPITHLQTTLDNAMTEFAWKRKEIAAKQAAEPVKKLRVLVLYTGGTIGMKWTERGLFVTRAAVNVRAGW